MIVITFYDKKGAPIAYLQDDGIHIYLFNGKPVAYLYENTVYGFNGKQFGWFEDGWIRDLRGYCVFFTENTTGGPSKPLKQLKPLKSLKQLKPMKSMKQSKVLKPTKSLSWSTLSGIQYFSQ